MINWHTDWCFVECIVQHHFTKREIKRFHLLYEVIQVCGALLKIDIRICKFSSNTVTTFLYGHATGHAWNIHNPARYYKHLMTIWGCNIVSIFYPLRNLRIGLIFLRNLNRIGRFCHTNKQEAQRATYRAPEDNMPTLWGIAQGSHFC